MCDSGNVTKGSCFFLRLRHVISKIGLSGDYTGFDAVSYLFRRYSYPGTKLIRRTWKKQKGAGLTARTSCAWQEVRGRIASYVALPEIWNSI